MGYWEGTIVIGVDGLTRWHEMMMIERRIEDGEREKRSVVFLFGMSRGCSPRL